MIKTLGPIVKGHRILGIMYVQYCPYPKSTKQVIRTFAPLSMDLSTGFVSAKEPGSYRENCIM